MPMTMIDDLLTHLRECNRDFRVIPVEGGAYALYHHTVERMRAELSAIQAHLEQELAAFHGTTEKDTILLPEGAELGPLGAIYFSSRRHF